MFGVILVIIVIIILFVLINKNGKNNTDLNIFTQNNDDIVKEKEKGNIDINIKNIDIPQNNFNPFIYDRLYNPYYTYTYYNYPYYNYPYYNYTYDIRPFPRQYPGRIHDYKSFDKNYNFDHKVKHKDKTSEDGKRK